MLDNAGTKKPLFVKLLFKNTLCTDYPVHLMLKILVFPKLILIVNKSVIHVHPVLTFYGLSSSQKINFFKSECLALKTIPSSSSFCFDEYNLTKYFFRI